MCVHLHEVGVHATGNFFLGNSPFSPFSVLNAGVRVKAPPGGLLCKDSEHKQGLKQGFLESADFEEGERHSILEKNSRKKLFFKFKGRRGCPLMVRTSGPPKKNGLH